MRTVTGQWRPPTVNRVTTAAAFDELLEARSAACSRHYGDRLVSLVVFGSVGRGTARPDSDVDFIVVADPLPDGRMAAVKVVLAAGG